jgi:hypothetical protein
MVFRWARARGVDRPSTSIRLSPVAESAAEIHVKPLHAAPLYHIRRRPRHLI